MFDRLCKQRLAKTCQRKTCHSGFLALALALALRMAGCERFIKTASERTQARVVA